MAEVKDSWVGLPQGLIGLFADRLKDRVLNPRDGAIWMAVLCRLDPLTGNTDISAQEIADRLKMQRPHVASSLQRLVAAGCLEKAYDGKSGTRFLSVPGCEFGFD